MGSAVITIIVFVLVAIVKGASKDSGNTNKGRPAPLRMDPQRYFTNPPPPQGKVTENTMGGNIYRDKEESFFDDSDYNDLEGEELDKNYSGSLKYESDPEGVFAGNLDFSSKEGLGDTDEGGDEKAYAINNQGYTIRDEEGFGITLEDLQKGIIMSEILSRPRALRKYGSNKI